MVLEDCCHFHSVLIIIVACSLTCTAKLNGVLSPVSLHVIV